MKPTDYFAPIRYRHRQTGRIEEETVYGENSLRWIYGNPLGRLTLSLAVKRIWFSRLYGWLMNRPSSRKKIIPFIRKYQIDTDEMVQSPDDFSHFNAFFYRRLQSSARPVDPAPESIVFPADGRHLVFPDLSAVDRVFVKGQSFALSSLLNSDQEAQRYARGSLILSRLCPVDYHRFHFPCSGRVGQPRTIPGFLFSVNPFALRQNLSIFSLNQRIIVPLETDQLGQVLMIPVGATCVGGIHFSFQPGQQVAKGDEAGYFSFGGSSIILLFEPGQLNLARDLCQNSTDGLETYARMGEALGQAPAQ